MASNSPKVFISYSWSTPEHEDWVLQLAVALRNDGADIILDKWDLKEGNDAIAFMEQMVTDEDVKKVILVCDREYSEKADKRTGGVGTEAQILSPKIYEKIDQSKFVAVVAECNEHGKPFIPAYYHGRIHIDLSEEEQYAINYEKVLRWIFDKPVHVKPDIGKPPAFIVDDNSIPLGTSGMIGRVKDAIRYNKPYANGILVEYLNTVIANMQKFDIEKREGVEFDDLVITSIEKFLPARNELIGLFVTIAQYDTMDGTIIQLHKFFEKLIPFMERPENVTHWNEWDFDHFRFIIQELFVYLVSILANHDKFHWLGRFLDQRYYSTRYSSGGLLHFNIFRNSLRSLDYREKRLELQRPSPQADLLKERCEGSGLDFRLLMQGDLILYFRSCLDTLHLDEQLQWWPDTLVYAGRHGRPFEIFARSQSLRYFGSVMRVFNVDDIGSFQEVIEAIKNQELIAPHWDYRTADIGGYVNIKNLATTP